MYRKNKISKTSIVLNNQYEGERIEEKIQRIMNNKEPINDGAPLIYTDRKDGVLPEYDVRTDRFDVAIDAMDKVNKSKLAKREERHKKVSDETKEKLNIKNADGGGEDKGSGQGESGA